MKLSIRLLLVLSLFLSQFGSWEIAPAQTSAAPTKSGPVNILRKDLERIFSDARFVRTQMGVKVFSLDRSEILYERNPQLLLIPASSNKIITTAVALLRLGPGFRFQTRVLTDGYVEDGILKGNLIIAGSGDPSYSETFKEGDPFAAFRDWASNLKAKNIRTISGSILGDEGSFGDSAPGQGWEWNDLSHAFAAPVGALQFNDNMMTLSIAPGAEPGSPAVVRASPLEGYLTINNQAVTGREGRTPDIRVRSTGVDEAIDVLGTIPAKGSLIQQTVSVRHPALYFLSALRHVISGEGVAVESFGIREKQQDSTALYPLFARASPELSEIIKPLLKNSLNLYAETLVRALGANFRGEATFPLGKEIVEETLSQMGVAPGTYSYADGSGLSRLNLESADSFVELLKFMHQNKNFQFFYDALPIAGVDGTLSSRMKRTRAEDNVHAKTGSLTNVSSISGYAKTADGEMLAFSIVMNGYIGPRDAAESVQDRALVRLTDFSRKERIQKSEARSRGESRRKMSE